MKRLLAHGLVCLFLLYCLNFAQKPELNPDRTFADGHVHSGFAYQDGAVVPRMEYFGGT